MHRKNIIYRDLKLENVLIDVNGHVKIIDFGLSKKVKNEVTDSFCGSP
jgi:serine/threonine protein kinase